MNGGIKRELYTQSRICNKENKYKWKGIDKFYLGFILWGFYRISKYQNKKWLHFYHYYDITIWLYTRKINGFGIWSVQWDKNIIIRKNIEFILKFFFLALNLFADSIVQKRICGEERYFYLYFFLVQFVESNTSEARKKAWTY